MFSKSVVPDALLMPTFVLIPSLSLERFFLSAAKPKKFKL